MKRFSGLLLAISLLLLCACTQREEKATSTRTMEVTTNEPTSESDACTSTTAAHIKNSALDALDLQDVHFETFGFIAYDYKGVVTDFWLEDDTEGFYILPARNDAVIYLYEILSEEDGEYLFADKPTRILEAHDGCVIYAELERPEAMPKWGLRISSSGLDTDYPLVAPANCDVEWIVLQPSDVIYAKPVIYLYPETETNVSVKLDYKGDLTCTYPTYERGWTVTAQPDGTLTDANGQIYNYLYWEGDGDAEYDFSQGFCVAGKDTAQFLEQALEQLGLTRREANEFIVYWLPLMQNNPYNVISFQGDIYTNYAPLEITPTPDSLLRVFMAWYPSETAVEITPQSLTAPERNGFTVVEWGGSQYKQ